MTEFSSTANIDRYEERSFGDALYEWMDSAPWLGISLAAHVLVYFVLAAIPWQLLTREEAKPIIATLEPEQPDLEEPEIEPEPEIDRVEPIDEPVLVDSEPTEVADRSDDLADTDEVSDRINDLPNELDPSAMPLGIGGNPGGGAFERRSRGSRGPGGSATNPTVMAGLRWLADHQSIDGYWDCDNFMNNNSKESRISNADMPGHAQHDVGVTGLALLAFLGIGDTPSQGEYKEVIARGINWLRQEQDPDTGLIGEKSSHEFLYNHSLATLALCEAYYGTKNPVLKKVAQDAVNYVQRARNPYAAWRYDVPPIGDNDTSVTGWMVFALSAAKHAGLKVDMGAFDGALAWIDEATDLQTGRVGYNAPGNLSSRTPANDHYPRDKGEAMTAVGLLCRIFIAGVRGEDIADEELLEQHANLLLRTLPEWDPDGAGCDMYYWYYGSYAMFQMGGKHWEKWRRAMEPAVMSSQRNDGDFHGSWDPIGPWGYAGGRVYSTAIQALSLEVYFRYNKVLGAR